MRFWRPLYYGSAGVVLLAALLSGARFLFVLFLAQAFLALASLAMNLWAALSFAYLQQIDPAVTVRGRSVRLQLRIHNEKPIPYPLMRIRIGTPDPDRPLSLDLGLAPFEKREFEFRLDCPHRGEIPVGMTVIDFVDIFGLVRMPFDMRVLPYYRQRMLLVRPRLLEIDRLAVLPGEARSGRARAVPSENQDEPFSTIRTYRPGDPMNRIHWVQSVRLRQLMTRRFDPAAEPRVLLLLDLGAPRRTGRDALEAQDVLCECALAILSLLLRRRIPVSTVSHSRQREVRPGRSLADLEDFHRWLATVPFDARPSLADQLAAEAGTLAGVRSLVLVTTRFEPSALPILLDLKRRVTVSCVMACPAAADGDEPDLAARFRQADLPAVFVHEGEDLERVLEDRS